jgi:hypothetical protein
MGIFGQSKIEYAVCRQLDRLSIRLWGSPNDTEETFAMKEKRLDEFAKTISPVADQTVSRARAKWIGEARNSLAFWRDRLANS